MANENPRNETSIEGVQELSDDQLSGVVGGGLSGDVSVMGTKIVSSPPTVTESPQFKSSTNLKGEPKVDVSSTTRTTRDSTVISNK